MKAVQNPHSRQTATVRTQGSGLNSDRQPIATGQSLVNPLARKIAAPKIAAK
jgi:hypothetical protein